MFRARSQNNIGDSEREAKFVQERIDAVEKLFAELCTVFAAYARKAARLRDKNDEVAKTIQIYAESEEINRSTSSCLASLAKTLYLIGDYRDAEVQRLNTNVILPLSQYQSVCKRSRENVKTTFTARDEELKRKRLLDKIRDENPKNQQKISQAKTNFMKATVEVSRVVKELEDQIDLFEKQKIRDLKKIILSFITVQLSFHAKALELFTKAYQDVVVIDEAHDLQGFRDAMRSSELKPKFNTFKQSGFRQAQSLINLRNPFSLTNLRKDKLQKTTESLDSSKISCTNSSDSVQLEKFDDPSSEESELSEESSCVQENTPTNTAIKEDENGKSGRLILKMVPMVPNYQKSLSPYMIYSFNYS